MAKASKAPAKAAKAAKAKRLAPKRPVAKPRATAPAKPAKRLVKPLAAKRAASRTPRPAPPPVLAADDTTHAMPPGAALLAATEDWRSYQPPVETTEEDWTNYGVALGRMERMVGWEIGDWWNRGTKFSNRVAIVTAPDWTGPTYGTCRNFGRISAKFPLSSRHDKLSFTHHEAVATEDPERAEMILSRIEREAEATGAKISSRQVKALVKRERRAIREEELAQVTADASVKLGHRTYGVIYADPPWSFEPYSIATGMDRAAANHYPTMSTDDMCAVEIPAAKDAVLFLWRTAPMLEDALRVVRAWGFRYKTEIIWGKDKAGTGYWARSQHEVLMICTRGEPVAPAPGEQPASLIMASVRQHSRKPLAFLKIIEKMYPNTARLDMFAREIRRGWDMFGNERREWADEETNVA